MSQDQRQRLLLGVLVAVILVIVWRQLGPPLLGESGTFESSRGGQATATGRPAVDAPDVVELRLEDLEKASGQFRPGRDPFRFGEAGATQTEPTEDHARQAEQEAAALEALRRATEAQRLQASAPSSPRPVLPDLDVKFLGSFGSRQKRLAVFSDGTDIFNVLEGGVLKGDFVIRQIGFESVDVGYLNYPDEPAIRLAAGG